ncbi:MAG TPA: hypothetical protein VFR58_07655 [Flavisolibacter sp.]|nr:hypothetical protein [Flavisolibacter sp.]
MQKNQNKVLSSGNLAFCLLLLNAIILKQGHIAHAGWYPWLLLTIPLFAASMIIGKRRQP